VDNSDRVLLRVGKRPLPIMKSVKKVMIDGQEKLLETFVDISERKSVEEELRASHDRLELALDSAGMGVWRWETRGWSQRGARARELGRQTEETKLVPARGPTQKPFNSALGRRPGMLTGASMLT
jgi:PAS domain-containing protein